MSQIKRRSLQIAGIAAASYLVGAGIDYRFFDYEWDFIWVKQAYMGFMLGCVLVFCLSAGKLGYLFFLPLCLFGATLSYAYYQFRYEMTYDGVVAVFMTNAHEVSAFVTVGTVCALIGTVLLSLALFWALRRLVHPQSWHRRSLFGAVSAALFVAGYHLPDCILRNWPGLYGISCSTTHRNTPEIFVNHHTEIVAYNMRSPFENAYLAAKYAHWYLHKPSTYIPAEDMASTCTGDEELAIILVIGESVRADHCSFNGYQRPTTADLEKLEPGIIPLPKMWSFGNSTGVSLNGIFGGLLGMEDNSKYTSFAGILKKHGYRTAFIAENTKSFSNPGMHNMVWYAYSSNTCIWKPILDVADDAVAQLDDGSKRHLLVIENGTGHYPYAIEERHRRFVAGVEGKSDEEREAGEVIANYDNAVYSVNLFLSRIIESVKGRNAVVIYCSDHGQLLGDDGAWFHGINKKQTRHVAAFIWFSPKYRELHPEYVKMVEESAGEAHHHGQLYPTILKLAGIESDVPLALPDLTQGLTEEQISRARIPLPNKPENGN